MARLRPSLIWTALFSAVVLVTSSQTAGANPFSLGTSVGANLGCTPSVTCPNLGGDEDLDFWLAGPDNGAGFVSVTDATDGFSDPDFTYSAAANASFGKLQARASGSYDLSSPSTRRAVALAYATDALTLSAPGLDGQAGTLDVSFLLDGTLQSSGGGQAGVLAAITWGGNTPHPFTPGVDGQLFEYLTPVPSGPIVATASFVWGQPFFLSMVLAAGAGTPISCGLCNDGDAVYTPVAGIGSATSDFYNTMTLAGLLPRDANGNRVLDAQFSSGSGTRYSVNGVVPEPGSLVLIGTGLAFAFRRRRRS